MWAKAHHCSQVTGSERAWSLVRHRKRAARENWLWSWHMNTDWVGKQKEKETRTLVATKSLGEAMPKDTSIIWMFPYAQAILSLLHSLATDKYDANMMQIFTQSNHWLLMGTSINEIKVWDFPKRYLLFIFLLSFHLHFVVILLLWIIFWMPKEHTLLNIWKGNQRQ